VELDVAELLDLLTTPAPFGGMEIQFQSGTNGGLVMGGYSAEGKYSVGFDATCLEI
jgi:hypothetical protein